MTNDPWNVGGLDLDAYLRRLDTKPVERVDLTELTRLQRAHRAALPFENLDIILGRGVALDLESLQGKLIRRRRGGYCYEHSLLFAAALERSGFAVTRLLARIVTGTATRPHTHMTLQVVVDGAGYLCDTGLGGGAPLEPIPLRPGIVEQDGWGYGLTATDRWTLRGRIGADWSDLYTVTLEPTEPVDYTVANHYTSTHPRSPFVGRPLVQVTRAGRRLLLDDRRFIRLDADGKEQVSELDDAGFRAVLTEEFGLPLETDEVDRLIELTR
ncbi:MAG TPA: arylamine N-acetyltransferase [Mycobacteriales bacterium]|nr:arylamine N-acetyltransferase [Mycobacteriales bacterium]